MLFLPCFENKLSAMHIHLISIGGAVMHNLALALQAQGHSVTGSDDEIFDPAKSRLAEAGLLPLKMGWHTENIHGKIDQIILGMHARLDNPELLRAQELEIPILSFPAFTFQQTADKIRMVVAGSHGKTTTTAMLMHVFKTLQMPYDYLVGSIVQGYDRMVQFSDAPVSIIEGDEYLSSPLDRRPKFLHYKPQLSMITGIAWDHINVFPTYENYLEQFREYLKSIPAKGVCYYNQEDEDLKTIATQLKPTLDIVLEPYSTLPYTSKNEGLAVHWMGRDYDMNWFGKHNVSNMSGAMALAHSYGIDNHNFLSAMQTFDGTARRLEKIYDKNNLTIIRDFAHSPSKVKATVEAVKEQYASRKVYAFFELHTFSSLQKNFLPHYNATMEKADEAYIYIDKHVFNLKKMDPLTATEIKNGFGKNVTVIDTKASLIAAVKAVDKDKAVILLMSSGSFSGLKTEDYI